MVRSGGVVYARVWSSGLGYGRVGSGRVWKWSPNFDTMLGYVLFYFSSPCPESIIYTRHSRRTPNSSAIPYPRAPPPGIPPAIPQQRDPPRIPSQGSPSETLQGGLPQGSPRDPLPEITPGIAPGIPTGILSEEAPGIPPWGSPPGISLRDTPRDPPPEISPGTL
jgi:hypothetical protein